MIPSSNLPPMATTVSFLFWNIRRAQGTRFFESLRRLAGRGIDVFIFAEPPEDDAKLLGAIGSGSGEKYYRVPSESKRLKLFSCLSDCDWADRFSGDLSSRITAHELTVTNHPSILLIGAHLHDPMRHSSEDRAEWARKLAVQIRQLERDADHARTILVGDLNMNPFDQGLVATTGLHALMTSSLTLSVQRMKSRREHRPFYNPMWSLLGDRLGRELQLRLVSGTYFHDNSQALASPFWQMFDQVLLQYDLIQSLVRLEILESDGQDLLISRSGRPRREAISDHLPLSFDIMLPKSGGS